ncbi:hypothetical protein SNE40_017927 [Patella caerulea]|uniref:CBM21 domain-containing protein n=2 Tax=Patella caerulea TaxID=87958 RepID=A0AAN8JES2_PATCE
MLDIVQTQACSANGRMAVDFTSYLLAASPPTPSSGYDLLSYAFSQQNSPFTTDACVFKCNGTIESSTSLSKRRNGPLKSIIIKSESCETFSSSEESTPVSPLSPGKTRKKVSFADHQGMALTTVRFLTEPSDVPPRLKPEVLASLTQGATAGANVEPPLKLQFTQPASDYLAFRDRLEKECVSLENVILKDYAVVGTTKVKNISFEKRVFVRLSLDSWESHEDVEGVFVPGPGDSTDRKNIFDTFSFEFNVPTNFGLNDKVEFAVGYEANNQQFWDNNFGRNYTIVSSDFKECHHQPSSYHREEKVCSWTEYACWNHVDNSTPYW